MASAESKLEELVCILEESYVRLQRESDAEAEELCDRIKAMLIHMNHELRVMAGSH